MSEGVDTSRAAAAASAAARADEGRAPEADDEFSAAAPPHPGAAGTGETSFGDADAPAASAGEDEASETRAPEAQASGPGAVREDGESGGGEVKADFEELVAASRQRDEYLALAQRTQADFENFRRRVARDAAQAQTRGVAKLAKELLPALDHLELAVKAAAGHEDVVKGFAIVRDEFAAALAKAGIEAFSPHGEAFDPTEHEAMASQPSEGAASGTVIEVYQQGYRLNGTVLRPARVVVAA